MGCKVIATASSESKRQICIEKGGADHALDYTAKDWQKQVMKLTGGKGADIVYDPVVSLDAISKRPSVLHMSDRHVTFIVCRVSLFLR